MRGLRPSIIALAGSLLAFTLLGADAQAPERAFVSPLLHRMIDTRSTLSVAVLPMQNVSVDPEVAYHFRQRVQHRLTDKGYAVVDGGWIDNILYELGLTHAGQLSLVSLPTLAELLDADAFVFGLVEEAATWHAVAFNGYAYQSSLKLQQPDGEVLWWALEEKVAKRRFAIDPINAFVDIALTELGDGARKASHVLADRLLASLPQGPIEVTVGDDLLNRAITLEASTPEDAPR